MRYSVYFPWGIKLKTCHEMFPDKIIHKGNHSGLFNLRITLNELPEIEMTSLLCNMHFIEHKIAGDIHFYSFIE